MSPISWPQWFPAFERSQKRTTECHGLIMYFRMSSHILRLLEFLHPHYGPTLCLSCPLSALLFYFSLALFFSQCSFISFFSFPLSQFFCPFFLVCDSLTPPLPFIPMFSFFFLLLSTLPLWLISPLFHSFTWTGGRAAGVLRPCVRDGNHRGDVWCGRAAWHGAGRPHPKLCRITCLHAPLVALSTYWEQSIKDNYTTNMY